MDFKNIISNKLKSSYPDYIKDNIALVSLNKDKSKTIGTLSYAYPIYPNDIDVFEQYTCNSYEKTINTFEIKLQIKVKEIDSLQDYWILEVKVGIDERFNFSITDQDAKNKINKIKYLIPDKIDILLNSDTEFADDLLRSYAILRWTAMEIIGGYKKLIGDKIITLKEAIQAKSPLILK